MNTGNVDDSDVLSASKDLAAVVILAGGASSRMGTPKATLTLPTGERLLDYHVRHALALSMTNNNAPIMIADNERGFTVSSDLSANHPQSPIIHIADYGDSSRYSQASEEQKSTEQKADGQIDTGGALVAIESALQAVLDLNQSANLQCKQSSWLLVISCDSLIPATALWQKLQLSEIQATDSQATESETTDIQKIESQTVDKKVICLTDDSHLYPLLGLYQLNVEPDLKAYIDSGGRRGMQFIKPIVQAVPFEKNWQHLTNFNTPEEFKRACASLSDL
ncbi:molybdenum cofactor guanylyltransferase [Psychrobacter fulvigenes]|uniref:molybdenum cofactor guanylyltransferase n=1 Tax=Psychrobacter fulvigenes TaxID=533323 RepID=UPI001918F316|nr:NTP transferase domain-containing protein [Psychrobacter fulvigenes]